MSRPLHRERGTASIEMAAILPLSILILVMIVLIGRLTWHAIVLTKSVADVSRIVATLPRATLVGTPDALRAFARNTLNDATRSAGLDIQPRDDAFTVMCGDFACVNTNFNAITVTSVIDFQDTIFNSNFQEVIPKEFLISSLSSQTYAPTTPQVPTND